MRIIKIALRVFLYASVATLFIQSGIPQQPQPLTTMDSLMAHPWRIYTSDLNQERTYDMYMRLSSTHMTDSTVWLSNELANVLTRPYYLSETPADEFDRSKVGRVKNGKYIIVLSTGTLGSKCSVYRIHHLRDDALVIESIKNGVVTAWMPVDY